MGLSGEMLELLLENIECGVFTVDTQRRITSWNSAAERITGFKSEEMIGRHCRDLNSLNCFSDCDADKDDCPVFRDGELKMRECVFSRPDGTTVRVLKNARLVYGRHGRLLGAVESLTDISALSSRPAPIFQPASEEEEARPVPGMIGASDQMREVYRLIRFAADSESTVLVTGESGTGKELVARAIHNLSRREKESFVAVHCSALPESLLESELFGHVKGAFSGAIADKVGRFELADKGTIFLDEIGDISPLIQLKLLRVLQNQEYQRVGESLTRRADVRVIAATNKDLLAEVRKGEFREDLFFRLKVFPISLPPLRERQSDITELVHHFVAGFNRKTGKNIKSIHHDAMKLLLDYCWPGNVRELEHAIEYAFVLCQKEEIGPFELPQEILRVEFRKQFCPPGEQNIGLAAALSSDSALLRVGPRARPTQAELLGVLEQAGWNQSAAARLLGVSRVTVWNWMKKAGIKRPGK
jgi:two-component system response regulator HydG